LNPRGTVTHKEHFKHLRVAILRHLHGFGVLSEPFSIDAL
jgi:hypothetical protein